MQFVTTDPLSSTHFLHVTQPSTREPGALAEAAGGDARSEPADRKGWTLASLVRDGARNWPSQLAVSDGPTRLTFAELESVATRVAVRLLELGVAPGDRVAIAGEREAATLVALCGATLAGAIYVPLDPNQPSDRLRLLLVDVGARVLIAPRALSLLQAEVAGLELMDIGHLLDAVEPSRELVAPIELPNVAPASVAYITFTSGSTGLPKGVQIQHDSIRAFFETHNERVGIAPGDRCLNSGPFYFDVSVLDVLLPLYAGATVFFAGKIPIPTLMLEAIETHRITVFYAVGTLLALITGDGQRLDRFQLGSLRMLMTGAEVCNVRVVNEWLRRYPKLRFLNSYGPTEVTVGCISYLKPEPGPLTLPDCPIGLPHRGTRALLIGEEGVISEPGKMGELVLAGPQLMLGYWQRSLEDRRAWVWLRGEAYYRTGDFVYVDESGNFHFVGRLDDEVKLHGHRIHLNEVRRCFQSDPRIEVALVGMIEGRDTERELAVGLLTKRRHDLRLALDFAKRAERSLPSAMRPTRLALLHTLPRLPSGKANRDLVLQWMASAVRAGNDSYFCQAAQGLEPLTIT